MPWKVNCDPRKQDEGGERQGKEEQQQCDEGDRNQEPSAQQQERRHHTQMHNVVDGEWWRNELCIARSPLSFSARRNRTMPLRVTSDLDEANPHGRCQWLVQWGVHKVRKDARPNARQRSIVQGLERIACAAFDSPRLPLRHGVHVAVHREEGEYLVEHQQPERHVGSCSTRVNAAFVLCSIQLESAA